MLHSRRLVGPVNNMNSKVQLNPEAPIFKASDLEKKDLTKIIASQNEDIISLKLLHFESQIEINKKDKELERLKLRLKEINQKL